MPNTWKPSKPLFKRLTGMIVGCTLTAIGLATHALEIGEKAPAFNLPGSSDSVDISNYRGKVVYLDFWASWCAPCKQSFPWMSELQGKYREAGLQIIAVNLDTKATEAQKFLAAVQPNFTIAFDAKGESARRYDVKAMPSSYLIDRKGNIQLIHTGFSQGAREKLETSIVQALKVQP